MGIHYFKNMTIRRFPAAEFHIILYHRNIKYVIYSCVTGCISSFRLFYCNFFNVSKMRKYVSTTYTVQQTLPGVRMHYLYRTTNTTRGTCVLLIPYNKHYHWYACTTYTVQHTLPGVRIHHLYRTTNITRGTHAPLIPYNKHYMGYAGTTYTVQQTLRGVCMHHLYRTTNTNKATHALPIQSLTSSARKQRHVTLDAQLTI